MSFTKEHISIRFQAPTVREGTEELPMQNPLADARGLDE